MVQEMLLKYIDRFGLVHVQCDRERSTLELWHEYLQADTKMTVLAECGNPQDAKGVRTKESEPILRSTYNSEPYEHK